MLLQSWHETYKPNFFNPFFMDWDNSKEIADFVEKDKQYIFSMDLPGFKKEDVKVEVKDHSEKNKINKNKAINFTKRKAEIKKPRILRV